MTNAKCIVKLREEGTTLSDYLWGFVPGRAPIDNGHFGTIKHLPSKTPESIAMSKALKKRGFSFVGPTICYALMQAAGLVNDHVASCFVRRKTSLTKRRKV